MARAPGVTKLAYDEAVRSLTLQSGLLDNLRTRAGVVISVATLVTSVLGGQVLVKPTTGANGKVLDHLSPSGWIAIAALIATVIVAVSILRPWTFRFDLAPAVLLASMKETGANVDESYRQLALFHGENLVTNAATMRRLFIALQVAFLLLGVETIAWLWQLRG
jgi:hypothetical protein